MISDQQIIEILAKREGRCTHGPKDWEREGPDGDSELVCQICRTSEITPPNYLHSLDALAPVLATLKEEEWDKLADEASKLTLLALWPMRSRAAKHFLTMKPHQLALCIYKAIGGGE